MIFLYPLNGSWKSNFLFLLLSSLSHCLAAGYALCARRGASSGSGPAQRHWRSAPKGRGQPELEQPRSGCLLITIRYKRMIRSFLKSVDLNYAKTQFRSDLSRSCAIWVFCLHLNTKAFCLWCSEKTFQKLGSNAETLKQKMDSLNTFVPLSQGFLMFQVRSANLLSCTNIF